MTRYLFSSICFIVCVNYSFCQDAAKYTKDSIAITHVKEIQIVPDTTDRFTEVRRFPFKSVTITDVRFDTTNIGIYSVLSNVFIPEIKNYKINIKGGCAKGLSAYMNHFFENSLGDEDVELVCFLKKLIIIKRDTLVESPSLQRTYGQVTLQVEVFLRSGKDFHAAFKIDTVLTESISVKKKEVMNEIYDLLLRPAISIVQNEIINMTWDKIMKKKSFSEIEVYQNYVTRRFNLPVLTQHTKKGIYNTFSEFKRNVPSIIDFDIKKGKYGTIVLTDKNGNNITTIKLFGFSDGENFWILNGNFCYPLIKTGNSFKFFVSILRNLKLLLEIDMDTGQII